MELVSERQDRNDKRRKIEAENRQNGTHLQAGHDYVTVKPLPSSSKSSTGLPSRPTWNAPVESAPVDAVVAEAVGGGNSSIVANRMKIRMANLSAGEMLKAELGGAKGGVVTNAAAALKLKRELMGEVDEEEEEVKEEETKGEVKEEEEIKEEKMDESSIESPLRGIKRKVEELATKSEEDSEESAIEDFISAVPTTKEIVIPGVGGVRATTVTTAPPITVTGNTVEQEDTVQ